MMYCNDCGTEIPEGAKFCPKCGATVPEEPQAQPAADAAPTAAPAEEQKPEQNAQKTKKSSTEVFNSIFWVLFVATGLCAYLFIDLASIYVSDGMTGFATFLTVMSIIFGVCFLVLGIGKMVLSFKAPAEERKAHAVCNSICLVVAIVLFVYVLLSSIGIFNLCSDISATADLMAGLQ